jgi:hypothetical protein
MSGSPTSHRTGDWSLNVPPRILDDPVVGLAREAIRCLLHPASLTRCKTGKQYLCVYAARHMRIRYMGLRQMSQNVVGRRRARRTGFSMNEQPAGAICASQRLEAFPGSLQRFVRMSLTADDASAWTLSDRLPVPNCSTS